MMVYSAIFCCNIVPFCCGSHFCLLSTTSYRELHHIQTSLRSIISSDIPRQSINQYSTSYQKLEADFKKVNQRFCFQHVQNYSSHETKLRLTTKSNLHQIGPYSAASIVIQFSAIQFPVTADYSLQLYCPHFFLSPQLSLLHASPSLLFA